MSDATTAGLIPEWAPQCATMLVWPHKDTDWGQSTTLLADINATYLTLTNTISRYQSVLIVCKDEKHKKSIHLQYAPLSVRNNHGITLLDFRFNGWGGKYNAQLDDQFCKSIYQQGVFDANRSLHERDPSGYTRDITFWGNRFIAAPQGKILASSNENDTTVVSTEIDISRTEQLRTIWPYFRDRRIDAYSDLVQRVIDQSNPASSNPVNFNKQ